MRKKHAEIELWNCKIIKLTLNTGNSGADITDSDYLEVVNKGNLIKTIFRSNLLG